MRSRTSELSRAATASVAVAGSLVLAKAAAFAASGSVAVLSSMVDSALDLSASGITWVALRYAVEPADHEHRYGHGKAEALAALAQCTFIAGSILFIVASAVRRLVDPAPIEHGDAAVAVMMFSVIVTAALVTYQNRVARRTGSMAVRADMFHYASDLLANLVVVVGIIAYLGLGWSWADPVAALMVAAVLLVVTIRIARDATDELMDRELRDPERRRILSAARGVAGVNAVGQMRSRRSGPNAFIELRVVIDGDLPLVEAHAIADHVEAAVAAVRPGAQVIVHQDPTPGASPT